MHYYFPMKRNPLRSETIDDKYAIKPCSGYSYRLLLQLAMRLLPHDPFQMRVSMPLIQPITCNTDTDDPPKSTAVVL
jgi:hypothetical protein